MDFLNAIILLLNYIFVPALTYGSQLALGAIFVTLIYGILRFANFATGDMMSFGTMFAILFTWYFQSFGISLGVLPTALIAIPFGFDTNLINPTISKDLNQLALRPHNSYLNISKIIREVGVQTYTLDYCLLQLKRLIAEKWKY